MRGQPVSNLDELLDRESIRDCLFAYCRAIDRCDRRLLESVYWPEGRDNHVVFEGSAQEFVAWVIPQIQGMDQTTHSLTNILIKLRGQEAKVESHFCAYHRIRRDEGPMTFTLGGRYLDHMAKRDGEWRILERTAVFDSLQEDHSPTNGNSNLLGVEIATNRFPTDLSYSLFGR